MPSQPTMRTASLLVQTSFRMIIGLIFTVVVSSCGGSSSIDAVPTSEPPPGGVPTTLEPVPAVSVDHEDTFTIPLSGVLAVTQLLVAGDVLSRQPDLSVKDTAGQTSVLQHWTVRVTKVLLGDLDARVALPTLDPGAVTDVAVFPGQDQSNSTLAATDTAKLLGLRYLADGLPGSSVHWVVNFSAVTDASNGVQFDGADGPARSRAFMSLAAKLGLPNSPALLVTTTATARAADRANESNATIDLLNSLEASGTPAPDLEAAWRAADPRVRGLQLDVIPPTLLSGYEGVGVELHVRTDRPGLLLIRSKDGVALSLMLQGTYDGPAFPVLRLPGEVLIVEYLPVTELTLETVDKGVVIGTIDPQVGSVHVVSISDSPTGLLLRDGGDRPPTKEELTLAASLGIRQDGSLDAAIVASRRNG